MGDQPGCAACIAIDEAVSHPRGDEPRTAQLGKIAQRISIAVSRRIVKRSTVELDDHSLSAVEDVLVGGLAGRGAVPLAFARRQPMCPLNSMQITLFQH